MDDRIKAAVAKSRETLGENAAKRVDHVRGQLHGIVGDEGLKELDFDYLPGPTVAVLEKVLAKATGVSFSAGEPPGGGEPPPTLEKLRKLQDSPEWRRGDPATVKAVTEGYKRLYPEPAQT